MASVVVVRGKKKKKVKKKRRCPTDDCSATINTRRTPKYNTIR